MSDLERPADSGHIHEGRFIPGVGVIPPPEPVGDPPPKVAGRKSKTSEGADEAPSVVEETN